MSAGEPTRPSSVSAARRSSWPGVDRDRPGRDPADPHLGRERAREHAGQHRLRRLRRAVRPERDPGLERRHVLDDHEHAVGLAQRRGGGLREEERPLGRHVERRVPVRLGHVRRPASARSPLRRRGRRGRARRARSTRPLHELGRAVARAQVAVGAAGGDHRPPVGPQALRDRVSDPPRAARDQRPAVWSL